MHEDVDLNGDERITFTEAGHACHEVEPALPQDGLHCTDDPAMKDARQLKLRCPPGRGIRGPSVIAEPAGVFDVPSEDLHTRPRQPHHP